MIKYKIVTVLALCHGDAFRLLGKWWVLDLESALVGIELTDGLDYNPHGGRIHLDLDEYVGLIVNARGNIIQAKINKL